MSLSVDKFKSLGNECMKNLDYSNAIVHYKNGLKLEPNNPILNCNIAQAHLHLKEYVDAEKFAKIAIEHQQDYTKAYFRAAKAAYGRHNVYECMLYLAQGVEHCSEDNIEDLYCMAKDLSPELEKTLRSFRDSKKQERQKGSNSATGSSSQSSKKKEKAVQEAKKNEKGKETFKKVQNGKEDDSEAKDKNQVFLFGEKGLPKSETNHLSENELLKSKLEETEKELEYYRKQEQELRDQEKREREKKELEEQEQKRKEQEKKEQEKREQEEKEREKLEQEKKEREKREREKREEEKREKARKEREKLLELEKREQALERKTKELLKLESEKKKMEDEKRKLQMKDEENTRALRKSVVNLMKEGSLALLKGLHRKAVDNLKQALDVISSNPPPETFGFNDPMDMVVLQFTFCQSLILSDEYNDIVKAIGVLEKLEKEGRHTKFPAIFLLLGRAYLRLNRFKNAQLPLERGLSFLSRGTSFSRYSWPGTYDVIELTDRNTLKDALIHNLQESKLYHKPDAICFHSKCLETAQHITPSRNIFFSDPDFMGFITLICQEKCYIYFHMSCWKDYKETLSEVEKLCEKDFLGKPCFTPDCKNSNSLELSSLIVKVIIIGPDGEQKSSCDYIPPTPSMHLLNKDCVLNDKSPKKKQRKKDSDKSDHFSSKRVRKDSRSVEHQETPRSQGVLGKQYNDALSKLATARQTNFGYENEATDAFQISTIAPKLPLGKDEEFVYSYFLEIFKNEGYMSVFKLQEHWEANKELLPVLQPALITHTDLVKFLLDTEGFVVVQDMIGIASELPNIASIVESRAEAPKQMLHMWHPSPATALEASKTLSFSSSISSNSDIITDDAVLEFRATPDSLKESEPKTEREDTNDNFSLLSSLVSGIEKLSVSEKIENSVCESASFIASEELLLNQKPIIPSESLVDEPHSKMNGIPQVPEKVNTFDLKHMDSVPDKLNTFDINHKGSVPEKLNTFDSEHNDPTDSSEEQKIHVALENSNGINNKNQKCENFIAPLNSLNVLVPHKTEKVQNLPDLTEQDSPMKSTSSMSVAQQVILSAHISERSNIADQDVSSENLSGKKAAWKPRAKLMEWAVETFPGESRSKLWQALTCVRTNNNYTLSGLSFDVIAERVQSVLHADGC